jgi:Zn-dependent peptidase ImmA (M78 family)
MWMKEAEAGAASTTAVWPVDLSRMRPEAAAEWVAARYGNGTMPIRPERIARRMGVEVYAMTAEDRSAVFLGPNGRPWIVVDVTARDNHQRFAIAHGLGHILLRHDRPHLETPASFGADAPDHRDRAANQFAASLLVPTAQLRWCVTSGWMRNVDQILKTLWVPEDLLLLRYRQMRAGR